MGTFRKSSDPACLSEHTKVLMALIVMAQGTIFVAHSVADIETLVDKKHFDVNMIIVWRYRCPKLALVSHF